MTAQQYRKRAIICLILALVCMAGPILFYACRAFIVGDTTQKLTMGLTFIVAGLFTALNWKKRIIPKSALWVLLLGMHYFFVHFYTMMVVFMITSLLEELIFTPLHKYYGAQCVLKKQEENTSKATANLVAQQLKGA